MTEQAKAIRRAYIREWRRNNPDKMRLYSMRYWERRAKESGNRATDSPMAAHPENQHEHSETDN